MAVWQGPLKKIHLKRGEESLEVKCLRDGSLDVCLDTGDVFGFVRGDWKKKRLTKDADGYLMFHPSASVAHSPRPAKAKGEA